MICVHKNSETSVRTGFLGTCDLLSSLEKYFSEYCNRFARQLRTVAAAFGVKKGQVCVNPLHLVLSLFLYLVNIQFGFVVRSVLFQFTFILN